MFNTSHRIFAVLGILAGIILVQACGRPLDPEPDCNFVQNSQMQRVSWKKTLPVTLYVDESVPAEYMPALKNAVITWNKLGQKTVGQDFFQLKTEINGSKTPAKDGYSKIYVLNHWDSDRPTEQARTTIFWSGSRIYEADIRINAANFDYFIDSERPDSSKVHLESLVVHELGHALGFAHNDEYGSVMAAELANGRLRAEPSSQDVNNLKCEYTL